MEDTDKPQSWLMKRLVTPKKYERVERWLKHPHVTALVLTLYFGLGMWLLIAGRRTTVVVLVIDGLCALVGGYALVYILRWDHRRLKHSPED